MTKLTTLLVAMLLSGCVGGIVAEDEAVAPKADYGRPITQQDAQARAEAFLAPRMKGKTTYAWGNVHRAWSSDAQVYGYELRGQALGTAWFGSTAKSYRFTFRNGELVSVYTFLPYTLDSLTSRRIYPR